jgi:hypothetical protein
LPTFLIAGQSQTQVAVNVKYTHHLLGTCRILNVDCVYLTSRPTTILEHHNLFILGMLEMKQIFTRFLQSYDLYNGYKVVLNCITVKSLYFKTLKDIIKDTRKASKNNWLKFIN